MPIFDIFASHESVPVTANGYTQLLLLHSHACGNGSANAEPADKKVVQSFLAKANAGRDLGHFKLLDDMKIAKVSDSAIDKLPEGAVLLSFKFTLAKRFLSRDDGVFFPLDNPLRRDHVFKVPFIPAATWKGNLRTAAIEQLLLSEQATQGTDRFRLLQLFGDEKSDEDDSPLEDPARQHKLKHFLDKHAPASKPEFEGLRTQRAQSIQISPNEFHQKGRLRFFPSWFDTTELDVLNPRNRKTRTGTLPIHLEAVPAGKTSVFTLLYVPFDLLGNPAEIAVARRRDWKLIGEALAHMLLKSGFGAKKSSGCGRIRPKIEDLSLTWLSTTLTKQQAAPISDATKLSELTNAFREGAE